MITSDTSSYYTICSLIGVITKAEKANILKLHKTLRKSVTPKATDMSPIVSNIIDGVFVISLIQ